MPALSFDSLTDGIALLLKPPLTIVAISAVSSESLRDLKLPESIPVFPFELEKSI